MGKREGTFCDFSEMTRGGTQLCAKLATDTCVVCERDVCPDHAMHPQQRALVFSATLLIFERAPGTPAPGVPPAGKDTPLVEKIIRECVCRSCGTIHSGAALSAAVDSLRDGVIAALRAELTTRALKSSSTP